jgi:hypothetical protein
MDQSLPRPELHFYSSSMNQPNQILVKMLAIDNNLVESEEDKWIWKVSNRKYREIDIGTNEFK